MVYKEENTKSKITIYCKLTDQKGSLQAISESWKSLKDSLPLQSSFASENSCVQDRLNMTKFYTTKTDKFKERCY